MLPELFHVHHNLFVDDIPYWLELAAAQDGAILELGCGTGRVINPLVQSGYAVYGLDRDLEMLKLFNKLSRNEAHPHGHIFQAEAEHFRLAARFALIIWPCNTMGTLREEAFSNVLIRVRRHLCEGGLFVATMPNPQRLTSMQQEGETEIEELITLPGSGLPLQVSSSWKRMGEEMAFNWHYDVLKPSGEVDRYTKTVAHKLHSLDEVKSFYASAGLNLRNVWGDFDRSSFKRESPYLIIEAH